LEIHVINLDRCKDRLSSFQTLNAHPELNFVRFPAIEGKDVARAALVGRGMITADLSYSDANLGCSLSHLALCEQAIEKNHWLTVCEDDAIFNSGFSAAAESMIQALPQDWHLILWGWNFDSVLLFDLVPGVSPCLSVFDQDWLRKGVEAFQAARLHPQAFRLFNTFGLVGYSVSPLGAQAMRQSCLPLRNMDIFIPGLGRSVSNCSLDVALNAIYRNINAYVCFPPLIVSKNLHSESTIQKEV
jgi:glycosyl transferase, family 25